MLQNFKYKIVTIAFLSAFSISLFATEKKIVERESNSVDLIHGSRITNTPYGGFIDSFEKIKSRQIENADVSKYDNKRIFVGYGIYDSNDDYCKYLDLPSNSTFDIAFENRTVIGDKTYAISRDKMTYEECLSKVSSYGGFVYTPKTSATATAILQTIVPDNNKDIWIGYHRDDCSKQYVNGQNIAQTYSNFLKQDSVCNENELNTYIDLSLSKKWLKSNSHEQRFCPIMIDSKDYLRPIKICLPWWRIERTWKINKDNDFFEFNNHKYDFSYAKYSLDFPKKQYICTQYDEVSTLNLEPYETTCLTYSSIDASPSCQEDIDQAICQVNECKGFIQDSCEKIDSFDPFKKYSYKYMQENGNFVRIKDKQNIRYNVYKCPPARVSNQHCLKQQNVEVFPVECPNSQCSDLVDCLKNENLEKEECLSKYRCEKKYGQVDLMPILTEDGSIMSLVDKCEDGTYVYPKVNILTTVKQQCLKYEIGYKVEEEIKKCTSQAIDQDIEIDASITDADKYAADERCIRINNIEEARPSIQTVFEYQTKGFFQTSIDKVSLSDANIIESTGNQGNIDQAIKTINSDIVDYSISFNNISEAEEQTNEALLSDNWKEKRYFSLAPDGSAKDVVAFLQSNGINLTRDIVLSSCDETDRCYTMIEGYDKVETQDNISIFIINKYAYIKEHRYYDSNTISDLNDLANLLKNQEDGSVVVISTRRDISQIKNSSSLKDALRLYGANIDIINDLDSSDYYIFAGVKNGSKLIELKDSNKLEKQISFDFSKPSIVALVKNNSCNNYKGYFGFDDVNIIADDYNFQDAFILDENVQTLCAIGGDKFNDDVFDIIAKNNEGIRYRSTNIKADECFKYADELSGDVVHSDFECDILVNDSTGGNNGESAIDYKIDNSIITIDNTDINGTFTTETNGIADLIVIQEYIGGPFGYYSNYVSKLPSSNVVLLDGKVVSPLKDNVPIQYQLYYDTTVDYHNETTKNKPPTQKKGSLQTTILKTQEEQVKTFLSQTKEQEIMFHFLTGGISTIYLLTSSQKKWGWYNNKYRIYSKIAPPYTKYVKNIYGLDPRKDSDNQNDMILMYYSISSGTLKKETYLDFRNLDIENKKSKLKKFGFSQEQIENDMLTTIEKNKNDHFPSIHWWYTKSSHTDHYEEEKKEVIVQKPVNTIFYGAVNTLTIVVPYIGDYELKAYDSSGNLLSTFIAKNDSFIDKIVTLNSGEKLLTQKVSHIQFALSDDFNIAAGQNRMLVGNSFNEGALANSSCLASDFVEWGGGVSGAYYEQGVGDFDKSQANCFKSNDDYVKLHAATKITIRPLNQTKMFKIDLKYPLPFPNRVYLITLGKQEKRKYKCWSTISKCDLETGEN